MKCRYHIIAVIVLVSLGIVSCDDVLCDTYKFINETDFDIQYKMQKINESGYIKAHESYERYLSRDLDVVITSKVPVYQLETATSITFREIDKYDFLFKNVSTHDITIASGSGYDSSFSVLRGREFSVCLHSKTFTIRDSGVADATEITTVWSGGSATVTLADKSGS